MLGDVIASLVSQFLCKFPAAGFGFRAKFIGGWCNYEHTQIST